MSEPFDNEALMKDGQTEPSHPEWGKEFEVTAVETIHRTYVVRGENIAHAEARLRNFFRDPQMMFPGIVEPKGAGERVRWLIRGEKKKPKAA